MPITSINGFVNLVGEIAGTAWGEDCPPGEYYYAVGAVNEFTETLSASVHMQVVALIPGLPPLAGLVIVVSVMGGTCTALLLRRHKHRRARSSPLVVKS